MKTNNEFITQLGGDNDELRFTIYDYPDRLNIDIFKYGKFDSSILLYSPIAKDLILLLINKFL